VIILQSLRLIGRLVVGLLLKCTRVSLVKPGSDDLALVVMLRKWHVGREGGRCGCSPVLQQPQQRPAVERLSQDLAEPAAEGDVDDEVDRRINDHQ